MIICKKCGAENKLGESKFCKNCLAPLNPSSISKKAVKSAASSTSASDKSTVNLNIDNENLSEPDRNIADDDGFEIKEVDFDDSSMGLVSSDDEDNDALLIKDDKEETAAEKIDDDMIEINKDLTLYRDDEMQITMEHTEDGPAITLTDRSDINDTSEQTSLEAENETDDKDEPPVLSEQDLEIQSDEENSMTQKIIINPQLKDKTVKPQEAKESNSTDAAPSTSEKISTPSKHDLKTALAKTNKDTLIRKDKPDKLPDLKPSRLVQSHGVAYFDGNSITIPGGFKPSSGEIVNVGNKSFKLKEKQTNKLQLYAGIGGGVLFLFVMLIILFGGNSSGKGQIVGILQDPLTGKPVPNAMVTVKELGKTTQTSYAGFFTFNLVPTGNYTVEVMSEGVAILKQEGTYVIGDSTTTLSFALPSDEQELIEPISASNTIGKTANKPASQLSNNYCFLKLKIVPPKNSKVYLDGKYIGKGSQTYKIPTGKHKVTVKNSKYKDYNYSINIPTNQIKSYTFKLKKAKSSKKQTKKSNEDIATELEEKGKYSEALTYYNKVISSDESNIEALMGQARCYKAKGDSKKSLSSYLKASKIAKAQNDDAAQLSALTGVLEINSNYLTARYNRGLIYLNQGENYRAAQDFSKVIEIDKRHLNAYYKLGEAYYKSKNYPAALEAYEDVQKLNFADAKPYAYIAQCYMRMDDKKNTKKNYKKFNKNANASTKSKFDSDSEWQKVKQMIGK
ncbi:MAG: carboxypeptidase regulatory-like domain-containing protein [candidate division Zixibacteria bacterium]|nr:carboxypeptidase regulatory-like domain-containing protein [candidate division Zixibacteria bacterium]